MMGELEQGNNNNWIWIVVAALLLFGGTNGACGTGVVGGVGSGNFLTDLKCGNNSWIWILALIFLFNGGLNKGC